MSRALCWLVQYNVANPSFEAGAGMQPEETAATQVVVPITYKFDKSGAAPALGDWF